MILPCEVAVKSVIPAVRSAIARELIQSHGLKQKKVAQLLGITQTAVSKYTKHCRGAIFEPSDVEGVQPVLTKTAFSLANGEMDKYELADNLCRICAIIRQSGLMCILCRVSDPDIDNNRCIVCRPNGTSTKIYKPEE
ncbi:MAG: helix-turn-helix domain-containing protein [Candidatus Bathyarchaeota archaeon]|nr:helix-turn-helix domain-containing protein [Candidatus Bathyarchaeum sp.]